MRDQPMTVEAEQASAAHDDHLLIGRVARGEAEACDAFVRVHQVRVTRLAARLLGWGEDVEDVVQEVFVAAILAAGRFRQNSSVGTWLTRITINKCRTFRRRRILRLDRMLGFWRRRTQTGTGAAESADIGAIGDEARERVRTAVARLPARDREVIVLRYFEQMEVAEVGEVLGLGRGTVEVRLTRARQRLRAMLPDSRDSGHGA